LFLDGLAIADRGAEIGAVKRVLVVVLEV